MCGGGEGVGEGGGICIYGMKYNHNEIVYINKTVVTLFVFMFKFCFIYGMLLNSYFVWYR